jgi:hypothetical protein
MEKAICCEIVLTLYQTIQYYDLLDHSLNTGSEVSVQPINTWEVFSILQHILDSEVTRSEVNVAKHFNSLTPNKSS